jgi:hypothetical protein
MRFTSQTVVSFIAATTISMYGPGVVGSSSESSLRNRRVLAPPSDTTSDNNYGLNDSAIANVVGGDESDYGEFPYYVLLGGCGGSLIAPRVVLTAAHCKPQDHNINRPGKREREREREKN